MRTTSLHRLADELTTLAGETTSGRAGHTIYGGQGHALRQTAMALLAGQALGEHDSPGEATLQVLRGRVRITTATQEWAGGAGEFVVLPAERHSLGAVEDSVVLLTVVANR